MGSVTYIYSYVIMGNISMSMVIIIIIQMASDIGTLTIIVRIIPVVMSELLMKE